MGGRGIARGAHRFLASAFIVVWIKPAAAHAATFCIV